MIAIPNVVLFAIMTLLATHITPKTCTDSSPGGAIKPPLLSTTDVKQNDEQWNARPFAPEHDQSTLEEMCRDTFGGSDYLPKMALTYAQDPNCHFQTLAHVDNNTFAAVANMRRLNPNMAWLEAVRTSEHYRNNGLAFRLLQSMLQDAVNVMGYKHVMSCTIQSNTAMRRVFDKLKMKELTKIQMIKFDALRALPGWSTTDTQPCTRHLLAALDMEHLVSDRARALTWSTVESKEELERILGDIQSKGGCGHMPGIYEVIDGQRVHDAIDEQLVFATRNHENNPAVMVFLRDKRISSLKSNWSLSLAGTDDEDLQAALWYACCPEIQTKLTRATEQTAAGFTVAFEGVIPLDGPICSALPLTEDTCFVYGTTLED